MKYRVLGKDLKVSVVSLGCMGMTHAYGAPSDETEMITRIREAYDIGYTMFDTAECYTGTNPDGSTAYNEELVGKALAPIRDQVVIATKCGVFWGPDGKMIRDSSPAAIRRSIEGSLTRLNTDHIDLYYQHRIDPKVEPETVAETMGELIREGKIRSWGISETTEEYLRRAKLLKSHFLPPCCSVYYENTTAPGKMKYLSEKPMVFSDKTDSPNKKLVIRYGKRLFLQQERRTTCTKLKNFAPTM